MYKTGRYKTFSDAVKAAYKKGPAKRSKPEKKKSVRKKVLVKRSAVKSNSPSKRQQIEKSLGASYVRFYKANTISETNKERRTMAELKKKLRKL